MSDDVELKISAQVEGDQDVDNLADAVEELADAGEAIQGEDFTRDYVAGLRDLSLEIKKTSDAQRAQLQTQKNNIDATLEEVKASAKLARASGESAKASKLEAQAKQLEIQTAEKSADIARLQARSSEKLAAIKTDLIQHSKKSTAQQKLELAQVQKDVSYRKAQTRVLDANVDKLRGLSKAHKTSQRSTRKLADDVKGLTGRFLKLSSITGLVTAALTTLGVGRIFKGALDSAREFEAQMSVVRGVSSATAAEFDLLKSAAEEMGASTRYTATEAAQGLEELLRAGQSATEAVATLPSVLGLAQGNAIELADAAKIATTTLNQFNLAATESGAVADVLTAGTQKSSQNIHQLAKAMEQAGPQAALMGISLEETVAIIGKLADQGFRGEKGGTALRNAMIQLRDPTSAFSAELRKLGIQSDDFITVLSEMAAKGKDSQAAFIALGRDTGPAIEKMVSGGVGSIRKLVASLEQSSGVAAKTARDMDDNFSGALKSLGSAFDAARRKFVDPLLEPLKTEIQDLSLKIREFVGSSNLQRMGDALALAFKNGAVAAKEFANQLDFDAITARFELFANDAGGLLKKFGKEAKSTFQSIGAAANALNFVFNAVQTGIFTVAAAITKIPAVIARVTARIHPLGFALDWLTGKVSEFAGGMDAVSQEFLERATQNARETQAAFDALIAALADTGAQGKKTADDINQAFESTESYTAAISDAADAQQNLNKTTDDFGAGAGGAGNIESKLNGVSRSIELLGKTGTATDSQIKVLESTLAAINAQIEQSKNSGDNEGLQALEQQARQAAAALEKLKSAQDAAGRSTESLNQSSQKAAANLNQTTDAAGEHTAQLQGFGEQLAGMVNNVAQLGGTAYDSVVEAAKANNLWADSLEEGIKKTGAISAQLRHFLHDLQDISDEYNRSHQAVTNVIAAIDSGTLSTSQMASAASQALAQYKQLDEVQLNKLTAALERARRETEAAVGASANLLQSYEDRLFELDATEEELAKRRLQRERDQLEAQLRTTAGIEQQNIKKSLKLLDEIEQKTLERYRRERLEANQQSNERDARFDQEFSQFERLKDAERDYHNYSEDLAEKRHTGAIHRIQQLQAVRADAAKEFADAVAEDESTVRAFGDVLRLQQRRML